MNVIEQAAPSREKRNVNAKAAIGIMTAFCVVALLIRAHERREIGEITESCASATIDQQSFADVVRAIQTMKLVTCEIDTQVRVDRGDENWRGIVKASVITPVRMRYGVNLERLDVHSIGFSPIDDKGFGIFIISVPQPQLLGTEIYSEREKVNVDTEGLRLRSIGGEYYLGLARRDAADAARRLTLRPADESRVREITADQLKQLIAKIVGREVTVVVRFVGDDS